MARTARLIARPQQLLRTTSGRPKSAGYRPTDGRRHPTIRQFATSVAVVIYIGPASGRIMSAAASSEHGHESTAAGLETIALPRRRRHWLEQKNHVPLYSRSPNMIDWNVKTCSSALSLGMVADPSTLPRQCLRVLIETGRPVSQPASQPAESMLHRRPCEHRRITALNYARLGAVSNRRVIRLGVGTYRSFQRGELLVTRKWFSEATTRATRCCY